MNQRDSNSIEVYKNSLKTCIENLKSGITFLQQYGGEEYKPQVEEMKKNLVDILRQDCRIGELQTMKSEVENLMKSGKSLEDSVNEYIETHDCDETKSDNWASVEGLYRETDLEVIESEISLVCPITMQNLKNPVKSVKCSGNHRYEKEAIYELLSKSQDNFVKCPVAGCNKKITKRDLIPDEEAIALINRGLNKYHNRNDNANRVSL